MKRMLAGLLFTLLLLPVMALSADNSAVQVNMYGYVKLDGAFDQNRSSHGNFTLFVMPEQFTDKSDQQFNMTANQTRLGANLIGKGTESVKIRGQIEFDLYGGVTGAKVEENKAMLQLRHAYFAVQSGNLELIAGQTWDLIAPLNPNTLNYSVMWAAGNTQYRRPQLRLSYFMKPNDRTQVTIAGGFFRTIGSDLAPTITLALAEEDQVDGVDDGTDAAMPSFQGMFEMKRQLSAQQSIRAGISGLWGSMTAEDQVGGSEDYESWGVFGHLAFQMNKNMGISGEMFSGTNLGSYMGGIANNNTVKGVDTKGGWGSLWVKVSPKVMLCTGAGVDDPEDADLNSGSRVKNSNYFGNVQYSPIPQFTMGLELSHWQTEYKDAETAKSFRAQTSFIFSF